MVCLGIEPGAAGLKARTNPLSYDGTPESILCLNSKLHVTMTSARNGAARCHTQIQRGHSFFNWAIPGLFSLFCCQSVSCASAPLLSSI